MDLMVLLQANVGPKCAGVHHKIQKDGYNVGYLSKEPTCTPQVFAGSIPPFAWASDIVQA